MRPGKHLFRTFHTIKRQLDINTNLTQVLQQHLLINQIILHKQNLKTLIPQPLTHIKICLFLTRNLLLCTAPIAIRTQIPFFIRVEDDRESRGLNGFVDEGYAIVLCKLFVVVCGSHLDDFLTLDGIGENDDRRVG